MEYSSMCKRIVSAACFGQASVWSRRADLWWSLLCHVCSCSSAVLVGVASSCFFTNCWRCVSAALIALPVMAYPR
eukprot:2933954-Rhodomonas_salina.1